MSSEPLPNPFICRERVVCAPEGGEAERRPLSPLNQQTALTTALDPQTQTDSENT